MQSIVYPGIFTSQAFLAIIFFSLGFFLFYKTRSTTSIYSRTDKKIYILMLVSFIVSIVFIIVYIMQLSNVFD